MSHVVDWVQWPRLGLAVPPTGALTRHLRAEYGVPVAGDAGARLRLHWSAPPDGVDAWAVGREHKGARWHATAGRPDAGTTDVWVRVRGPFAASLVQSQLIEPLLAAVTAREDRALVPAASIGDGDRVELVLGDSGSGKTTLAMRAAGAGWRILGDDRVFLGEAGVEPFRRRHRVYPDAAGTAPEFVAHLAPGERLRMRALGALSVVTGGFIRLPTLVPARASAHGGAGQVSRTTLLVRGGAGSRSWTPDMDGVITALGEILDRDRRDVSRLAGPWGPWLAAARTRELEAVRRAITGRPIRVVVSSGATAEEAAVTVAEAFGIRA